MQIVRSVLAHPSGRIGGLIVLVYLIVACLGYFGFTPHDPLLQHRIDRLRPPSAAHWMGTDLFGRDVMSRLMAGIAQSFVVGFQQSEWPLLLVLFLD